MPRKKSFQEFFLSVLVLVFICHRSQIHPGMAGDAHNINTYSHDLDQCVGSYCHKNDILFVNFLPYLVESAQRGKILYFLETGAHYNSEGHELAAMVIYDFLAQELFAEEDKQEESK